MPDGSWTGKLLGGRYLLGDLLGEGGVGAVYEAVQQDLGRRVAIKVLLDNPNAKDDSLARLEREARTIASLEHPNIVQVIEFKKTSDGPAYMVMDLLRGRSLNQAIEEDGLFSQQRIAFVVDQVLAALTLAHGAGVIHRDLKPHNIVLTSISGVEDVVKLLDFGIAKYMEQSEDDPQLTKTGLVLGTPAYMAPEHLLGLTVDGRSDLYSLGVVLYKAVCGDTPFNAPNHNSLIVAIMRHVYQPLNQRRPDLDDDFVALVDRAMAKDADDRFSSAEQMRQALEPWSSAESGASDADGKPRDARSAEATAILSAATQSAPGQEPPLERVASRMTAALEEDLGTTPAIADASPVVLDLPGPIAAESASESRKATQIEQAHYP